MHSSDMINSSGDNGRKPYEQMDRQTNKWTDSWQAFHLVPRHIAWSTISLKVNRLCSKCRFHIYVNLSAQLIELDVQAKRFASYSLDYCIHLYSSAIPVDEIQSMKGTLKFLISI